MTADSEAGRSFDRFLDAGPPAIADIARALRESVLAGAPNAVETFDPADRLLAFGTGGGSRRDFWFAIIPHSAHVNLQLADGADLPNPDGRIEGTGTHPPRKGPVRRGCAGALAPGRRRASGRVPGRPIVTRGRTHERRTR